MNLKFVNNDLIVFIGGDITFYPYLPSLPFPGKGDYKRGTDYLYANRVARQRLSMGVDYVLFKAKKLFSDYTIVDDGR